MPPASPPFEIFTRWQNVFAFFLPRARAVLEFYPETVVTSWYRDQFENAQVGGSPISQHLLGFAFDAIPPPGVDWNQFAQVIEYFGMIAVVERDHVHVQFFPAGALQGFV